MTVSESEAESSESGDRPDAAGPSKRSKRVAALASKAGVRQRAVKTEDSSIDSPSDSPPLQLDAQLGLERLERVTANLTNSDTLRTSLTETLTEVRELITQADASAFELEFSGFIDALTHFLMSADLQPPQEERVRAFVSTMAAIDAEAVEAGDPSAFGQLVGKLQTSVAQLEQFHVRASDLFDAGSGSLRGASAIRFFQTHQIRCTLRRHPECKELREWRHGHGSIRVDPFTQIGAIERYLLDRGLGQARATAAAAAAGTGESSGDDSNDATSDDDELDDPEEAGGADGGGRRRLELVIGDRVLPSHMTVLQAIRQHSVAQQSHMLGGFEMESAARIWVNITYIIYYRVATDEAAAADATASPADGLSPPDSVDVLSASSASSASVKKKSPKEKQPKVDEKLWNGGVVPERVSPLAEYLTAALPLDDPSNKPLALLRILYGINTYWWWLFSSKGDLPAPRSQLIGPAAFVNAKLSSKVGRQLQDVLSVATQQIPHWVYQLSFSYPFALSFGIRRNFLYCTAFGRDRAMMHLVNQSDSGGQSEGEAGRMTPRLERKKVSVRRDDLLKQAEDILGKMGTSRAMLEVGFESEVGTGIGPTLEFYSAVSRELQKYSLKLWHGDAVTAPAGHAGGAEVDYVAPEIGLFPNALPATTSARQRDARARKFEFIGRLMGQALIDGRMLDLPLNPIVFKWLLAKEQTADLADLALLDADVHRALLVMCAYSASDLEHMQQTFTMPGNDSFELYKNGGGELVTPKNVRQFAKLVAHWRLIEGVRREMEALRRGLETSIDVRHLRLFQPEEMEELFCGSAHATSTDWDEPQLRQFIKPDHGYTHVQVKQGTETMDAEDLGGGVVRVTLHEGKLGTASCDFDLSTAEGRLPFYGFVLTHPHTPVDGMLAVVDAVIAATPPFVDNEASARLDSRARRRLAPAATAADGASDVGGERFDVPAGGSAHSARLTGRARIGRSLAADDDDAGLPLAGGARKFTRKWTPRGRRRSPAPPRARQVVLVVGGGLAGLSAAIEAARSGAAVTLLDGEKDAGGNSAKASNGINGCQTAAQRALGLDDAPDKFAEDTLRAGNRLNDERLVRELVDQSGAAVEFLKLFGVNLMDVNLCGGHSVARTHWIPSPKEGRATPVGFAIMKALKDAFAQLRKENPSHRLLTETTVERLLTAESGAVVGVQTATQKLFGKVVLATGGFGNDHTADSLLQEFAPDFLQYPTTNGAFARGAGVKLARAVGAQLIGMKYVQVHPTGFVDPKEPAATTKFLAAEALRGKGALLLSEKGARFGNELRRHDELTAEIEANCARDVSVGGHTAYLVMNEQAVQSFGPPAFNFYFRVKAFFKEYANADALAELAGFEVAAFKRSIEDYNAAAESGAPDAFGKSVFPAKYSADEKIYLSTITPSIHYTMGGVKIDEAARVLDAKDALIDGLFAAGEVTGGVHGSNRLAGNSLLECVVFGRLAGKSAAAAAQGKPVKTDF